VVREFSDYEGVFVFNADNRNIYSVIDGELSSNDVMSRLAGQERLSRPVANKHAVLAADEEVVGLAVIRS